MRALVASSILATGCWSSATPSPHPIDQVRPPIVAQKPRVPEAAEFGTFDGREVFTPTLEIPLFTGSVFGWRIKLPCTTAVDFTEELKAPRAGDWNDGPDMVISKDRRTATIEGNSACEDGWIIKQWSVSPNDPDGAWTDRVMIDGYETQTFRATFELPAMTGGPNGTGPTPITP